MIITFALNTSLDRRQIITQRWIGTRLLRAKEETKTSTHTYARRKIILHFPGTENVFFSIWCRRNAACRDHQEPWNCHFMFVRSTQNLDENHIRYSNFNYFYWKKKIVSIHIQFCLMQIWFLTIQQQQHYNKTDEIKLQRLIKGISGWYLFVRITSRITLCSCLASC